MFIRDTWVKNTKFHSLPTKAVLDEVVVRSRKVLEKGRQPVVVFDLDSTLFDVSRRSYEILQEWMSHPSSGICEETVTLLRGLKPEEMKYSLQDVWEGRNIPHDRAPFEEHMKSAKHFWRQRFFGNDYLHHDVPTRGAIQFVKNLYELGVKVVYLTGRDVPQMAFGTFDQLKMHGLPIEVERTRLILKPKRAMDDLDFKTQAAQTIKGWGEVVASFENEPKNLVAMAKVFGGDTMNVFIESVSSDHPAPAGEGIYRIEYFD